MLRRVILIFYVLVSFYSKAQTTDLSIVLEAQDLSGNPISQATIYQDFRYLVTIINSGNAVNNSAFSLQLDTDLTVNTFTSINNIGGASVVSNFNLNDENLITGSILEMPNNSSVQILIDVTAPTNLGGIAATTTINPPNGVTDTNTSNNQSIISIDIIDIEIDFSVTHSQISPAPTTPIDTWGDFVTYQFTITNNSAIDFPLNAIEGNLTLTSNYFYGQPIVKLESMECIETTNGTVCPNLNGIEQDIEVVNSTQSIFIFDSPITFTSGGSITFEIVYQYLDPLCGLEALPLEVDSFIQIYLNHDNESPNISNPVPTNLIEAELCPITDICIETVQIDPDLNVPLDYGQPITLETTVCNNGPLDAPMRFFLQNLSTPIPQWNITSVECTSTTGSIFCNDISITEQGQLWFSNEYVMPANSTITVVTVIEFVEPECSSDNDNIEVNVRSATNILDNQLVDSVPENNFESDFLILPSAPLCPTADLSVIKTQTNPILPQGISEENTAEWGEVTYEILISNNSDFDAVIELSDYMPVGENVFVSATLNSVECIATTGNASCFEIQNANVGVLLDGEQEDGEPDIFWEILPEENRELPANSSVTFKVVINWFPECSTNEISGVNTVEVDFANTIIDTNTANNSAFVKTFFAPCIDLVVQTFPEFTQVNINQAFDWVIDISNSSTSSDAIDVLFEDTINPVFDIIGTPICIVTSGNATCISSYNINGHLISGIIPEMEAGSSIQIRIPVMAPSLGGAFNNIAEAIVSAANNEELTPETNTSISNVQVIAPTLAKVFEPNIIIVGEESLLTFTITNLASNPAQNNIDFTDNLPNNIVLSGNPFWQEDNGCTASFIGETGDASVGVFDLTFPQGVASCSFSVWVTSNVIGNYLNNTNNFTDSNNIDTSQTTATLSVIEDPSDVDIEILKDVSPTEASIGDEVSFTITVKNLGTTTATDIEIFEQLPSGYELLSVTNSIGNYDPNLFIWNIDSLASNQSETLIITAKIISSMNLLNVAYLNTLNETDRDETNNEDSAIVTIDNCLQIPEGFSPNNDSKNDVLLIPCIEDYQENTLKIYNRYGSLVFEANNYDNSWNGKANTGMLNTNELLPVGTYYYIFEVENLDAIFGWVYLNY